MEINLKIRLKMKNVKETLKVLKKIENFEKKVKFWKKS